MKTKKRVTNKKIKKIKKTKLKRDSLANLDKEIEEQDKIIMKRAKEYQGIKGLGEKD